MGETLPLSLLFGLLAALSWGVHDVCVRFISQKLEIIPTLFIVLFSGLLLTSLVASMTVDWKTLSTQSMILAAVSGPFFYFACYSLYAAFSIGPVKLVAPLIASYPIIFVAGAHFSGVKTSVAEWVAVATILFGISLVAMSPSDEVSKKNKYVASVWAISAGLFFAIAFSIGQKAATLGPELATLVITRTAAVLCAFLTILSTSKRVLPILLMPKPLLLLGLMGVLDALAIGAVIWSSRLLHPEYAVVSSSIFGLFTIVLARIFLRELMTFRQWVGVLITFSGVAFLGL